MKLEYEFPELTERQKRNASRLLKHAVIPERRTVYFDTKRSMASFLRGEMSRTGKNAGRIAREAALPEENIIRLADTGEATPLDIVRTFNALGIDVISIPAK